MNEDLAFLLKHRRRGALLDANLLLVYLIGKTYPSRLAHFHHTQQYKDDFPLIERLVEFFPKISRVSFRGWFFDTLQRAAAVPDQVEAINFNHLRPFAWMLRT